MEIKREGSSIVYINGGYKISLDWGTSKMKVSLNGKSESVEVSLSSKAGIVGSETINIPGSAIKMTLRTDGTGKFSASLGTFGFGIDYSIATAAVSAFNINWGAVYLGQIYLSQK